MKINPRFIGPDNYTRGRGGVVVNLVVIHIMEGNMESTFETFNNPLNNVSAHYGISYEGSIDQYLHEENTGWHTGSTFRDNQRSIGIEHEGYVDGKHWEPAQLAASAELTASILMRYNLTTAAIVGHRDLKPLSGHTCPGADFPMLMYKQRVDKIMQAGNPAPNPPKPLKITMPLYVDRLNIGTISFTRSTGKAFLETNVGGKQIDKVTMRAALKLLGYASILSTE